jgi:hypothetical protein
MTRPSPAAPILAVLAIVLVVYVFAYLSLLLPIEHVGGFSLASRSFNFRTPAYRIEAAAVKAIFHPLCLLDQYIRPRYWHEDIPPPNLP